VRELAVLLEQYLDWKRDEPGATTRSVANQLHVSRDRLTALEKGTNFFDWDLPWRIKALIDPAPERQADKPRGQQRRHPRS
jgi:hypothetical protein